MVKKVFPHSLAECCILGMLASGLTAIFEIAITGNFFTYTNAEAITYFSKISRVLWGHVGFGLLIGAVCFLTIKLLRLVDLNMFPEYFDVAITIPAVLFLPLVRHLQKKLPVDLSLAEEIVLAGTVVAIGLLIVSIILTFLINKCLKRNALPRKLINTSTGILLAFCAGTSVASIALQGPADYESQSRPNIIFISIDTVRADHLQVYRYPKPTSPNINQFAGNSVVFESAYAPEPWTLPSHMTMMTSLYPVVHNVRSKNSRLNSKHTTLAEVLQREGYYTQAFVASHANSWIGGNHGFSDGFNRYYHSHHFLRNTVGTSLFDTLYKFQSIPISESAEDINSAAFEFLKNNREQPFFLFLHYYDAHSDTTRLPYEAPANLVQLFKSDNSKTFDGCDDNGNCASAYLGQFDACNNANIEQSYLDDIIAHYDGGIRDLDEHIGNLLDFLKLHGIYDDALIILTSDHGEEFLEHGRFLHTQLYRENLHVPLIIKFPKSKLAGKRIATLVEHVDLMPSILDYLIIDYQGEMQGHSIIPYLHGHVPPARELFASKTEQGGAFRTERIATQGPFVKMILPLKSDCNNNSQPLSPLFFDLTADPYENNNLAAESLPDRGVEIKERLINRYSNYLMLSQNMATAEQESIELSQEDIKKLKALGYLGD